MAVAFRSSKVSTPATATNTVAVLKPVGLTVGDVMVGFFTGSQNSTSLTPPSGWTALDSARELIAQGGKAYTFWKLADSTDTAATDFTFTYSASVTDSQGSIMAFSGADQTTPINQHLMAVQTVASLQTSLVYAIGFTPAANCMLVLHNTGGTTNTSVPAMSAQAIVTSSPTWTEDFDSYASNGSFTWGLSGAYGLRAATTLTGDASMTSSVALGSIGSLIAIAPNTTPAAVASIPTLLLMGV